MYLKKYINSKGSEQIVAVFTSRVDFSKVKKEYENYINTNTKLTNHFNNRILGNITDFLGALAYDSSGEIVNKTGDIPNKVNKKMTYK